MNGVRRKVETELEVRVEYRDGPGRLGEVLKTLREAGGDLKAHLVFREGDKDRRVGLFLCREPEEGALALKEAGFDVTTGAVVTVQTENREGAFGHLVRTLEVEGVEVAYSYSTAHGKSLLVVLRADDIPLAEGVLRNYLQLPDPQEPVE